MREGTSKNKVSEGRKTKDCPGLEKLYDFNTGNLKRSEKKSIQSHLNRCETCFKELTSLVLNANPVPGELEENELKEWLRPTPEEQIEKIMSYIKSTIPKKEPSGRLATIRQFWQENWAIFFSSLRFERFLNPLVAIACIGLLVVLGRPLFYYWQSEILVDRGKSYLIEHYSIYSREEPRPSGGFKYDEFSITRDKSSSSAYDKANTTLQKAIDIKKDNSKAHQYLATYYLLIKRDLDKAKVHYQFAFSQDSTSAYILNDLGILAYKNGAYTEALERFSRALELESNHVEAQYNLGILLEKLGRLQEARTAWNNYLKLDANSDWAEVVREHLDRLK